MIGTCQKLFITGIFFSFFIVLIPCFFAEGLTLITGERIKSPYSGFTTAKPAFNDIVGVYKLPKKTIEGLHLKDSIAKNTKCIYRQDSTFEFIYFPYHEFSSDFDEYKIVNAKGKWSIIFNQSTYSISMSFDSITNVGNNTKIGKYETSYDLKGSKPPFSIYITIGDPDSWEGIELIKEAK